MCSGGPSVASSTGSAQPPPRNGSRVCLRSRSGGHRVGTVWVQRGYSVGTAWAGLQALGSGSG
eukprot:3499493-Prymnesium_polylepis.1